MAALDIGSGAVLAILGGLAILLVLGLVTLRNERRNVRYRIGLFFDREVGTPHSRNGDEPDEKPDE